jgi:hypothetical protein
MRFHSTKSLRRTALTGTIALAATAGLVGLAAPASAAGKDGSCQSGELCLYYFQNRTSHVFDLYDSDANFSGDTFPGATSISADNETRSYYNRDVYYWRVYDGANYSGEEIVCIAPGDRGNFARAYWERASSARWSSQSC